MIALCLMIKKVKLHLQINRGEHSMCQKYLFKEGQKCFQAVILNRSIVRSVYGGGGIQDGGLCPTEH